MARTKSPWVEKTKSGFEVEGQTEFLWVGHLNSRNRFPEEPLLAWELSLACSTWAAAEFTYLITVQDPPEQCWQTQLGKGIHNQRNSELIVVGNQPQGI